MPKKLKKSGYPLVRRLGLLGLILSFLAGCAKQSVPTSFEPSTSLGRFRSVAKKMEARRASVRCFSGVGHLSLPSGRRELNSLVYLTVEPPYDASIYFVDEAIGETGQIHIHFDRIEGLLPNGRVFQIGNTPKEIQKLTGILWESSELIALVMGLLPVRDNEYYQEWWMDPEGLIVSPSNRDLIETHPVSSWPMAYFSFEDEERTLFRYQAMLDDYRPVGSHMVPFHLSIQGAKGKERMEIQYEEVDLWPRGCNIGG